MLVPAKQNQFLISGEQRNVRSTIRLQLCVLFKYVFLSFHYF